ncbi:MAG: DNA/RNA non-specific endonuclease [Bacteroidales bacterium]|nr:DNA/RNA non-specific endonuclease [Bacteroidales bacterium]
MNRIRLLLLAVAALAVACTKPDGETFSVSVKNTDVDGSRGTQFVQVTAAEGEAWTLAVTDENGIRADWAEVDPAGGIGPKRSATVTWDKNMTGAARTMVIHGTTDRHSDQVRIVQAAYKSGTETPELPSQIKADPVPGWLELPATDDASLYFITHESNNAAGRNYSFYWDTRALVANWVAYPLNKNLIGSGSRTNEWGLDPKLPRDVQPVLYSGYRSSTASGNIDGGTVYYDRGHQLPSADRLNPSENVQTFYGTNITPQVNELNSYIWASLEGRVRDWSKSFDTLYVVSGCVTKGSNAYAYDNDGKKVTVPVGYYKALLGYDRNRAKGITSQTLGYTAVGFYLEQRPYSDENYLDCAMTIDELEKKVGVDLFVNLPSEIGNALYDKVESTRDSYWWTGR